MNRRSLIALAGTGLVAGCTGPRPPGFPRITDTEFARVGGCNAPGTATVSFENDVVVAGCIRGPNSCAEAVLAKLEYDATDTLRVVIGTEDTRAPNEACAEVIVHRGYVLRVSFDDGLPGTVVVVHRSLGEDVEVTRARR